MSQSTQVKVGSKVELPGGEIGIVVGAGDPGDELRVKLESGMVVSVDPLTTEVKVLSRMAGAENNTKEDESMNTTTVKEQVQSIEAPVVESRILPEISPEEILVSSKQYLAPLPSGAKVKVSLRKIAPSIAKLVVEDELGSRTFTVMASKREAGEIYIPQVETKPYTKRDGTQAEAVVLEAHGQANALLVAIAKRVMAAEGITLGQGEELEVLDMDGRVPF